MEPIIKQSYTCQCFRRVFHAAEEGQNNTHTETRRKKETIKTYHNVGETTKHSTLLLYSGFGFCCSIP